MDTLLVAEQSEREIWERIAPSVKRRIQREQSLSS
jgi:hypothetical protein